MTRQARIGAVLLAQIAAGWTFGGEPPCTEPLPATPVVACFADHATTSGAACCLRQLGPVGGWNPYGGGLLRWWNPNCFPRCCAPDDYCRKSLPRVCWPTYPAYYIWASPEVCSPQGKCPPACGSAH
jgi:hypothetical protein